ncbi:MAG: carbamoyl phosphate synthase small subunit, partial [Megasphaera micronuciformis]|nr:carbamoyl phosphate synthase small subunit [Megasphaera micronuciformis]
MKGILILESGERFYGKMLTAEPAVGEVVFNTGMTGYQETFTDPSYAGQIIT